METYKVTVQRSSYCSGVVEVKAKNSTEAIEKVRKQIRSGKIQPDSIEWDTPEVNDDNMIVTGDVD